MADDGSVIGSVIRRLNCVDSTNRRLAEEAAVSPEGTVLIAEEQSAGRGRFSRTWYSNSGSLTFSFLLRPNLEARQTPLLVLFPAVSVARTLCMLQVPAVIKWPNDIESGGRKLAGILVESRTKADRLLDVVVGIGLNVNQSPDDFPPNLRAKASSAAAVAGRTFEKEEVFSLLLRRLDEDYRRYFRPLDGEALRRDWLSFSKWKLGEPLRIRLSDQSVDGRFLGLTDDGRATAEVVFGGRQLVLNDFELEEFNRAADN